MDRRFILTAFAYAILGLALGIHMAASQNHGQHATHAHIMLNGFLLSFIYGLCHKLWLDNSTSMLEKIQFFVHQLGALTVLTGLFLYYGQHMPMETLEPVLASGSVAVLLGLILMMVEFIRWTKKADGETVGSGG